MSDKWDEMISDAVSEFGDYEKPACSALRAEIAKVEQERDNLQKREYELLTTISKGKKIKANAIYDFDRYQTAINAGYVDGLLYEHRARLAKGSEA